MSESFLLFGLFTTSWLEILSFLFAITMVLFNIRQSPWGWLFAILSAGLYAVVFYEARIYGDMSLQLFFIAISIWGAYQWLFGGDKGNGITVSRMSGSSLFFIILAWLLAYAGVAYVLSSFTDTDVPHIDAFLTAGSLVAQYLLSRKKIENWLMWIVIDLLYIGLYVHKNLMLTALLYALFAALAAVGWYQWRKSLHSAT